MRSKVAFAVLVIALACTPPTAGAADLPGDAKVTPAANQPPVYAVAGRSRVELLIGTGPRVERMGGSATVVAGTDSGALVAGFRFTRWFSESLAFTATVSGMPGTSGLQVASNGISADSSTVTMIGVGARWNPLRGDVRRQSTKPYLTVSLGPVFGTSSGLAVAPGGVQAGSSTEAAIGGLVGGGIDAHASRRWSFGVEAGYRWMADFSRPVGGASNFHGFQLTAGVGWVFGNGDSR